MTSFNILIECHVSAWCMNLHVFLKKKNTKKNVLYIEVQTVKKGIIFISTFTFWAQCQSAIFRYAVGKEVSDKLNASKIVSVGEDYNTDSLDSKVCTICIILWCFVTEKYRENWIVYLYTCLKWSTSWALFLLNLFLM